MPGNRCDDGRGARAARYLAPRGGDRSLPIRTNVMFDLIGAVIGCLLGFAGPFLYAQLYIAHGGDPTAAGGLFIVTFITIPLGLVTGAIAGFLVRLCVKRSRS